MEEAGVVVWFEPGCFRFFEEEVPPPPPFGLAEKLEVPGMEDSFEGRAAFEPLADWDFREFEPVDLSLVAAVVAAFEVGFVAD